LVSYEKRSPYSYKEFDRDRLVVPWLNWSEIRGKQIWTGFDPEALETLHQHDYLLCGICGEKLGKNKIYGQLYGQTNITSGSGMHPACALLAWKYCPDLNRHQGFSLYSGEGHGLKLGEGAATLHEGTYDLSEVFLEDAAEDISIDQIRALAKAEPSSGSGRCPVSHQTRQ